MTRQTELAPEQLFAAFPEAVERAVERRRRTRRFKGELTAIEASLVTPLIELLRERHLAPATMTWLASIGPRHRRRLLWAFKRLVDATASAILPLALTFDEKEQTLEALADEVEGMLGLLALSELSLGARIDPLDLVDRRWESAQRREIRTDLVRVAETTRAALGLTGREMPEIMAGEMRRLFKRANKTSAETALGFVEIGAFFAVIGGKKQIFVPIDHEISRRAMERHPALPAGATKPSIFFHCCPEQPNRGQLMLVIHEMIHALDAQSLAPIDPSAPAGPEQVVAYRHGIAVTISTRGLLDPPDLETALGAEGGGMPVLMGLGRQLLEGWTQARTIELLATVHRAVPTWPIPSEEEIARIYPTQTRLAQLLFGTGRDLFELAEAPDPLVVLESHLRRRFSPRRAAALAHLIEHHRTSPVGLELLEHDEAALGPLPVVPPPTSPEAVELAHAFRAGEIDPTRLESWLADGPDKDLPLERAWRAIVDEYADQWQRAGTTYASVHRTIAAVRALRELGDRDGALALAKALAERARPPEQAEALLAAGRDDLAYAFAAGLPLATEEDPLGSYGHGSNSITRAESLAAIGRFAEAATSLETQLALIDAANGAGGAMTREAHLRGIRLYRFKASQVAH